MRRRANCSSSGCSSHSSSPPRKRVKRREPLVTGIDDELDLKTMGIFLHSALQPRPSLLPQVKKKNCEKIQCIEKMPDTRGRQRSWDVFKETAGPLILEAKFVETVWHAFDLFCTDEMMDQIEETTSRKFKPYQDCHYGNIPEKQFAQIWSSTLKQLISARFHSL